MPFMHSESKFIHEIAVKLFSEPGLERSLSYELSHKSVIDRFGRFPERNFVLGRLNTPEEEIYLMNAVPPMDRVADLKTGPEEWRLH